MPPSPSSSLLGQTVAGRYVVERWLGGGGMGEVYLATDLGAAPHECKQVALKSPLPGMLLDDPKLRGRFIKEVRTMSFLTHPNIVRVLGEIFEVGSRPVAVMQYLSGGDLDAQVSLPVQRWLPQIAGALDYLHGKRLVHRDVKPGNILFDSEGTPYLGDFGIVKSLDGAATLFATLYGATQTGFAVGAPKYMSPEAVEGRELDGRTDQYALAITAYERLSGRIPFDAATPVHIFTAHLSATPRPLSSVDRRYGESTSAVLSRALSKRASDRYSSCVEFASALLSTLGTTAAPATPPPGSEPRRPPQPVPAPFDPPAPVRAAEERGAPRPSAVSDDSESMVAPMRRAALWHPAWALGLGSFVVVFTVLLGGWWAFSSLPGPGRGSVRPVASRSQPQDVSRPQPSEPASSSSSPEPSGRSGSPPPLAVAPFDARQARGHQDAWSEHLGEPREITNSLGMKLVLIPPGEYMMGSPESEEDRDDDEGPQHRVRITRPFYLGAQVVTVGAFRRFVSDTGYRSEPERDGEGGWGWNEAEGKLEGRDPKYHWRNPGFPQTDEHPVVNVTWNDAVAFCQWLSRREGREYRLPTESEWEYACRAGTTTRYYHGDDAEGLAQVGNVADAAAKKKFPGWTTISASDGYVFTSPVGKFRPNGFGLYDMHGNVWEWCADWFDSGYYANSPVDDPQGPASGSFRVNRGGGWSLDAGYCRSAYRDWLTPDYRFRVLGFRLALVPADE